MGIACGLGQQTQSVFNEQTYLYSTEQEFTTTDRLNDSLSVQCGVKPEIRIKNREPLQEVLGVNETFTAGDFPVTVISATGSNGVFSGVGYVQVPYLLDTKIKVTFDGITLNTERQLIAGKLVTTYDKTEKNIFEIPTSDFLKDLFDVGRKINEILEDGIVTEEEKSTFKDLVKKENSIVNQIPKTEDNKDVLDAYEEKNTANVSFINDNFGTDKEVTQEKEDVNVPQSVVQVNKKIKDIIKVTIVSEKDFEENIEEETFIPSYSGVPIKFTKKVEALRLDNRGGVTAFKINNETYLATTSLGKFYGYLPKRATDSLSLQGTKSINLTEESNAFLQKVKFKDYIIATKGDNVVSFAKRIEGNGAVFDCLCKYSWKEESSYKTIETAVNTHKKIVPEYASAQNCEGTACQTEINLEGLGSYIFLGLSKDLTNYPEKLKQLEELKQYLDAETKGKTYAIYDPNTVLEKQIQGSNKAYIQYFKDNNIYSIKDFKTKLKYKNFSRDVAIIFSTEDLRREIPENYNAQSYDFRYKDGRKYEYSFADLTIRYEYMFLKFQNDETIVRVIKQREREGTAQAISTHEGYEQYVGKYGTSSAVFFWMGEVFLEIADPVQVTQATKLVRTFLNSAKNIEEFSKQSIENKRIVNELFEKWQTNKNKFPDDFVKEQDKIWKEAGFEVGKNIKQWKQIQIITNKYPTEAMPIDGQLWGIAEIENGIIKSLSNKGNTFKEVDFVVTTNGELKIGKKHHFLGNASDVEAAGTIKIVNGKIKKISNSSGHYFSTIDETNKFPEIFRQLGIDTKGASLEINYLDNTGKLKTQTKFINE